MSYSLSIEPPALQNLALISALNYSVAPVEKVGKGKYIFG